MAMLVSIMLRSWVTWSKLTSYMSTYDDSLGAEDDEEDMVEDVKRWICKGKKSHTEKGEEGTFSSYLDRLRLSYG